MRARTPSSLGVIVALGLALGLVRNVTVWRWGPWQRHRPTPIALPTPNARDRYLAAVKLLPTPTRTSEGLAAAATATLRPRTLPRPRPAVILPEYAPVDRAPALAEMRRGFAARYGSPLRSGFDGDPACRLLDAVAQEHAVAVANGKWADAVELQLDKLRLSRDLECGVVTPLCFRQVFWAGGAAEVVDRLSGDQARAALTRARAIVDADPSFEAAFTRALEFERDTVAAALSSWDGGPGRTLVGRDGRAVWQPAWLADLRDWLGVVRGPAWRDLQANLAVEAAWAKQPYGTPLRLPRPPVSHLTTAGSAGHLRQVYLLDQAAERMFVVALAVRVWQCRHAASPARLTQLCPGLLPSVPLDPFDDEPLRYRREGDSYRLWSVGGDRVDDDGSPAPTSDPSLPVSGAGNVRRGDEVWGLSLRAGGR